MSRDEGGNGVGGDMTGSEVVKGCEKSKEGSANSGSSWSYKCLRKGSFHRREGDVGSGFC